MSARNSAAILLFATIFLRAQPPAPTPPDSTPPKKPGTIEGTVTNSVTGGPVKKATVTLRNGRQGFSYLAMTDAAGHFAAANIEPGTYTASASRDGFMQPQTRDSIFTKPVAVAEEQHVTDVVVKLMPLAIVNGRVLDEEGEPLPGANVGPLQYSFMGGQKRLNQFGGTNTNDLGEFQLLDLRPGKYYFQVTFSNFRPPSRTRAVGPEESYPTTYYPNVLDLKEAASVEVTAGAEMNNVDFRLHKIRSYRVSGKVVDASGRPARNAAVRFREQSSAAGSSRLFAPVGPDGAFEIRALRSGTYVAMCQDAGNNSFARQSVSVSDDNVAGVLLTLAPGIDVSGTMQVDGTPGSTQQPATGQPAAGRPQPRRQVTLQPVEQVGSTARASVESDDSFVIHNVFPDVYRLTVSVRPGEYLKTIRFGEREVPSGELDLTQPSGASIQLTFGTDGGQITGTVQDKNGENAQRILIMLSPADELQNRSDLFKLSFTDPNGTFRMQDVAPGSYKVFAWEDYDMQTAQIPEIRKAFESRAASVNIGPNARESVQLKAISSEDFAREKSKLQ